MFKVKFTVNLKFEIESVVALNANSLLQDLCCVQLVRGPGKFLLQTYPKDSLTNIAEERSKLVKMAKFKKINGEVATFGAFNRMMGETGLVLNCLEDLNGQIKGFLSAQ